LRQPSDALARLITAAQRADSACIIPVNCSRVYGKDSAPTDDMM
jgi:hypothetical protein